MVSSSFHFNQQRQVGDNTFTTRLTQNTGESSKILEKVYAHGYCQTATARMFGADGRERIFGDPPDWLKEVIGNGLTEIEVGHF